MLALTGIYKNGHIILDEKVSAKNPVKVIVTFISEEVEVEKTPASDRSFSFRPSQQFLNNNKRKLPDTVIEDKHQDL